MSISNILNKTGRGLSKAGQSIYQEFKKDKSYWKGTAWLTALVVTTGVFTVTFATGGFFLTMTALALPFSAPILAFVYIIPGASCIPVCLFLFVIMHQTHKQARYHFRATPLN